MDALFAALQRGDFGQGAEAANVYARAVANVRDELAKTEEAAKEMGAAMSTLGDLMTQNMGGPRLSDITRETAGFSRELNGTELAAKDLGSATDDYGDDASYARRQTDAWDRSLQNLGNTAGRVTDQIYAAAASFDSIPAGQPGTFVGGKGSGGGSVETTNLRDVWQQQLDAAKTMQSFADQVTAAGVGGIQAALNFAMAQQAHAATTAQQPVMLPGGQIVGGTAIQTGQALTESEIVSQVTSLYQTLNQQNPAGQAAQMQAEMAWLQSRPTSVAQQQAIAQLQQSIEGLTKSTDALNATNQELLSPYYTLDPRTSHIGFRSQGMATGGWVDVPGGYSANDNMIASIPVASGERIFVDPMGSRRTATGPGHTTINISQPIMIAGNADKDQLGRTLFQSNQGLAKQINAATAR
jgi:hypothetical protein